MSNQPAEKHHHMDIAIDIRAKIAAGVSMKVIQDYLVETYGDKAPKSTNTLYKIYRGDIAAARASIQEEIGGVVVSKAREGDLKAAELFLRSKGGWSPQSTENQNDVTDELDEDTSAIDDLMTKLGKNK